VGRFPGTVSSTDPDFSRGQSGFRPNRCTNSFHRAPGVADDDHTSLVTGRHASLRTVEQTAPRRRQPRRPLGRRRRTRRSAFYGSDLRVRAPRPRGRMAFVDMGDQFVALAAGGRSRPTRTATSGSSSTTRRPRASAAGGRRRGPRERPPRLPRSVGETTSRSSTTARSSSRRPRDVARGMGLEGLEKSEKGPGGAAFQGSLLTESRVP
jgi:hypothetical protein